MRRRAIFRIMASASCAVYTNSGKAMTENARIAMSNRAMIGADFDGAGGGGATVTPLVRKSRSGDAIGFLVDRMRQDCVHW